VALALSRPATSSHFTFGFSVTIAEPKACLSLSFSSFFSSFPLLILILKVQEYPPLGAELSLSSPPVAGCGSSFDFICFLISVALLKYSSIFALKVVTRLAFFSSM